LTRQIIVNGKFLGDPLTGVQRYAWEIVSRLLNKTDQLTLVVPSSLQMNPAYTPSPNVHTKRIGWGKGHFWQQFVLPKRINPQCLLWTPSGLGPIMFRRQILTVHDLSFLEHPEWFSRKYRMVYGVLLPLAIKRAVHIITSSEFSKRRMIQRLNISPSRITVVPCAVSKFLVLPQSGPDKSKQIRARYSLPEHYVLALGSIEPRKNLRTLVEAILLIKGQHPDVKLVLVGGRASIYGRVDFPPEAEQVIQELGYVPDADLPVIYQAASVFVYPSLYEGFGIPPLEAMAAGTPVITSNTTSLPEVVGDAALTVPPTDACALAQAIQSVLTDRDLRQMLITRGSLRVSIFSWDRTAKQVHDLLERLAVA
jgi:glycosyltransferase involved in cell wall biosynthesis